MATGHGGHIHVVKHLSSNYANITRDATELFKSFCTVCQEKRRYHLAERLAGQSLLNKEHLAQGQIDTDVQSLSLSSLKWIMMHQDCVTKFCVLCPLTWKNRAELILQFLDIFLIFGALVVLEGHDGIEFVTEVMQELKYLWLQLSLVHGETGQSRAGRAFKWQY